MQRPIRILLADDHAIVRAGYRHLLERQTGLEVIAEADNAQDAYRLYRELQPDIFITDISMPGASGLDAIRRILTVAPEACILVFSMHVSPDFAQVALQAGAKGYITKSSSPDVLLRAIPETLAGRRILSPDIAKILAMARMSGKKTPLAELTPREFDLLRMLITSGDIEQIGAALHLSPKTIQNLHYQIKRKLGVSSDIEMTKLALSWGLGDEVNAGASAV